MSTGSVSDTEDLLELRVLQLPYPKAKRAGTSELLMLDHSAENSEEEGITESSSGKRKRISRGLQSPDKKQPSRSSKDGKQSQRNAANARERARMRVLSKAFSRLKTSLPWVPPDTKLSKLDTLRLASSYIAHLRQLLQEDRYENSFVHPVNLVRMKLPYSQHQSASRAASCRDIQNMVLKQLMNYNSQFPPPASKKLGLLWLREDQTVIKKMLQPPLDYAGAIA